MVEVVDLTYELYSGMSVYPGDPKVRVETFVGIKDKGYKVSKLSLGTHTSTHVDAQAHMVAGGKTLSDYDANRFIGKALLVTKKEELSSSEVLIVKDFEIDSSLVSRIIELKPKLLGFTKDNEPDVETTKRFLEKDILLVGPLKIGAGLPREFLFCAFPLRIRSGDGSPVRAVAIL